LRVVGSYSNEELLHISFRRADASVNVAKDSLLLLPHVDLAVFPIVVCDDGSSDDQAKQQRYIEGATVAIL